MVTDKRAPQIADNVPKEFDCLISEPSVWLLSGTTTEKGLSFIDKKGKPLNSSIFRNLAFFDMADTESEETAIEKLVYTILFDCYHFEKTDVRVIVSRYG